MTCSGNSSLKEGKERKGSRAGSNFTSSHLLLRSLTSKIYCSGARFNFSLLPFLSLTYFLLEYAPSTGGAHSDPWSFQECHKKTPSSTGYHLRKPVLSKSPPVPRTLFKEVTCPVLIYVFVTSPVRDVPLRKAWVILKFPKPRMLNWKYAFYWHGSVDASFLVAYTE